MSAQPSGWFYVGSGKVLHLWTVVTPPKGSTKIPMWRSRCGLLSSGTNLSGGAYPANENRDCRKCHDESSKGLK